MEVSEERGCVDEDAARRVVLKNGANQQSGKVKKMKKKKSWHAPPEVC